MHGAVPLASLSHLSCLHRGLFNEGREHRHAVQYTCEGGPRHCGYLRRETPGAFGPSFTWSSPAHSNMCYVANGKVLCAKKDLWQDTRMGREYVSKCVCVFVRVIVSVESGACVCSVHTANVAVRSGADMHARHKFKSPGDRNENLAHFVSPQLTHRPASSCFLNTPIYSQRQQTPANQPCLIRELRLKRQVPSQV